MLIATIDVVFSKRSPHEMFYDASQPPQYSDSVTKGLRDAHLERWRDVWDTTEEQAVRLIKHDKIDILVDLAGYTPFNGLPICAAKPAPIVVSAWGYALPLGWPKGVVDYLFTDETVFPTTPEGVTERLYYLPSVAPFNCALPEGLDGDSPQPLDRKSTRLNSSH